MRMTLLPAAVSLIVVLCGDGVDETCRYGFRLCLKIFGSVITIAVILKADGTHTIRMHLRALGLCGRI